MARIHIELPERFDFSTDIALYIGHMNHVKHLDNALLLTIVSEARVRFFESLGYGGELDIEGLGILVADAALQYRSEAQRGEVMAVSMAACEFNRYGCDLVWQMRDKASAREVARGKTGIVFFDYAERKMVRVPPGFAARFDA